MKATSGLTKLLLCAVLLVPLVSAPARVQAQGAPQGALPPTQKPVMENVFYNVVWGSATGAILGLSVAIISSPDASSPTDSRASVFNGATAGGLIGLGVGLYLVYQGITFNPASSQLQLDATHPEQRGAPLAQFGTPRLPFELITSNSGPLRITGFKASVFSLRF